MARDPGEEANRQLTISVGRGAVTLVDDTGVVQTAQVNLGPVGASQQLIENHPILYHYGFAANPPIGAHFVSLFVGGRRSDGVAIATAHPMYRKTGLASGDVAIHDSRGASVLLTATGTVIDAAGGNVTIQNAANVSITGSGNISLTAGGNLAVAASGPVTVNAPQVTVKSDNVSLGDAGGPAVARVGDTVAGGVITSGSAKVTAA